jgi:hypothetical protein
VTHSRFNAALLASLAATWPGDRLVFLAEPSHAEWVVHSLRDHDVNIAHEEVLHPPSLGRAGRTGRAATELRIYAGALRRAQALGARALTFCSVSKTGLLALKTLTPFLARRTPVLATLHQLAKIERELPHGLVRRATSLAAMLRLPAPVNLRLAVPSTEVLEEFRAVRPGLARGLVAYEPPVLEAACTGELEPPREGEVCFGFFGSGAVGRIEPFVELVAELAPRYPGARFLLVGRLREGVRIPADAPIEGAGTQPLSDEEFLRRASQVHWAVWNGEPSEYRFTLSASFLDAVAMGRPCLCRRTPLTQRYFERLGPIGHLFDTSAQLRSLAETALREVGPDEYRRVKERAVVASQTFSPPAVGLVLADCLGLRRNPG